MKSIDDHPTFPKYYTIFSFISTANLGVEEFSDLSLRIHEKMNEITPDFNISFSFSKYDLIIEISYNSVRLILPVLKKIVEDTRKKLDKGEDFYNICYSNVFAKKVLIKTILDNKNKEKITHYPIFSYTFLRVDTSSNDFLNIFNQELEKISKINSRYRNIDLELFWNMNIFQYIVKIKGHDFFLMRDLLYNLLTLLEDKVEISKISSIYNLNYKFNNNSEQFDFEKDKSSSKPIHFMSFLNLDKKKFENLSKYRRIFYEEIDKASFLKVKINEIFSSPGWYDYVCYGEAHSLYQIIQFIFLLRKVKDNDEYVISQSSTNLLISGDDHD